MRRYKDVAHGRHGAPFDEPLSVDSQYDYDIDVWNNAHKAQLVRCLTDYPIAPFGDAPNETAPVRDCIVRSYDGNKIADVEVEAVLNGQRCVVRMGIKAGYLYQRVPVSKFRQRGARWRDWEYWDGRGGRGTIAP